MSVLSAPSVSGERDGTWMARPGLGVYVHIPFCLHRCHYCDFNTYEDQSELHDAYTEALITDIGRWSGTEGPATSVFFGGGTPTLLTVAQLGRILRAVRDRIGIAAGAEITIEANPETVDERVFEGLLRDGFNRFSVGVQSLAAPVLRGLGRSHSAEIALDALRAARRAGVEDLNADLIYGSPWERPADWRRSLEGIVDAAPDHVSAYALTVEQGTPLRTLVATGRVPDIDPDLQAERHDVATEVLGAAGYEHYEISNWSRPGRASAHNVLYWSAGNYSAFGAGAHGHLDGTRWWNVRLPRHFIDAVERGRSTRGGQEELDPMQRVEEAVMLGLRLAAGIPEDAFALRFGPFLEQREPEVASLVADGFLERSLGRLSATEAGARMLNEIVLRLCA